MSVLFSGCQRKENIYKNEITVAINSESGSLNPSGVIAMTYLAYSAAALDEMITHDENGQIVYRAAQSYEVNDDLTLWTFNLRKNAKWSDGSPVTAEDFINTMRNALTPLSGNGYSNYLFFIENAEDIYNGILPMDSLGVKAIDEYTLQIKLSKPCVYFLDLLRLPVYTPSCTKYTDIENWDKNPDTSVSNGPFYLLEYVPEQYFVLEKNPYYWNKDNIKLDKITFKFFNDQQSMANAYKAGEIDVATNLPSYIIEQYQDKADLVTIPMIATRYIYPNLNVKPLDDVRVRQAITIAINRKELCEIVGKDAIPTVNFVSKFLIDKSTDDYFVNGDDTLFEEDIEKAQELLSQVGYPNGEGFPKLIYKYPSIEMDSDTAQVIQSQLKKNLNIDIELQAQELQVNYSDRRSGNFDLCRMNWTADFSDANTYLSMLLSNSTYNCSGINDKEYDEIVQKSDVEFDLKTRSKLLHEAERKAVSENFYVIPLFAINSCNLINPKIKNLKTIPASGFIEYRYIYID